MAAKKKVIATVSAVAASAALLLGGTLAWQSTNQTALNEGSNIINPGGRLHDDFDGTNKDVYVENFADEDIFARIRLEEYFEIIVNQGTPAETPYTIIGEKTLKEGAAADPENNPSGANLYDYTYEVHNFNTTDNKTENAGLDGDTPYWKWTLGGETVYMPTFNMNKDSLAADLNGEYKDAVGGISNRDGTQYENYKTYTEGQDSEPGTEIYDDDVDTDDEVGRNFDNLAEYDGDIVTVADKVHTAKKTENAQLISMADWIAMVGDSYDEAAHGNYWVYDEDGWVYWSAPIKPDTATGLLLDGIELNQKMDDTWYYAINVVAQFVTADDLGSKDDGTGFFDTAKGPAPSENAINLLDKIGVDVGSAGEGDDPIETDEFAVRVTDTEGNSWTTVDGKLELSPSVMSGYTLSVANDAYSADDYTWEITENYAVMDSELWDNGDGTFSLSAGFDEHDGSYVVITVTEKATNEIAATVKITLDEDNQYPDPEPDVGETDITTLTITADPHDWYVPTGGTSYITLTAQLTDNGEAVEDADLSAVEWNISAKARSGLAEDTAITSKNDGTATLTIAPGETNNILVTASYTDAESNETYTGELEITYGPPVATIWAYDMDANKFVSKLDYPLNGATYNVKFYFFPEYTGTIQPIDKAYSDAEAEALASKLNISTDVGVEGVTVTQNESDRSVIKVTIAPNVAAEFSIHYDIDGDMNATLDFNPPTPELVWTGRDSADPQGAVYLAPGESAEYELINLPDSYDLTDIITYSVTDVYGDTAGSSLSCAVMDGSNGRKVTVTHTCEADSCDCYYAPYSVCAEYDDQEITSPNVIRTESIRFALVWEDSSGYTHSEYFGDDESIDLFEETTYILYLSSGRDITYTGDNNFTWSCDSDDITLTNTSSGKYVCATFNLDRSVSGYDYTITAANEDGETYTLTIYWNYTPAYSVDIWNDSTADTYTYGGDTISFYAVVYDSDWESPANFAKNISWTIGGEGKGNAAITYNELNEYDQETFILNTADADGPLTLTAVYTAADGEEYSSEPITLNVVYPAAEGFKLDEESTSFVHPANSYVMEYTDSDNNSYTSFEITEVEDNVASIADGNLVISEDAPEHAKVVIAVKNGDETVAEIPLTVSHKMTFKVTSQVPGGDKELSRSGDVDDIWAGDTVEVWLGNDVQVPIDYFDQPELGVIYPEDYEAYGLELGYDAEGNNIMSCIFNQAHGFGINATFESSTGATISDHMGVDVQWHYFVKAEYSLDGGNTYTDYIGETIFLKDADTLTIRAYGVDKENNTTDDQPTEYEWFIGEDGNNPTYNTDAFGPLEEGVSTEQTGAEYTIPHVENMTDNQTYQFYISTELHNFCTVEVVKGEPAIDGPDEVSTNADDNYFSTNTGKNYTFSVTGENGEDVSSYAHFATYEDEYPHGYLMLSEEADGHIGEKLIITATPDGFEGEPLTKEVTIIKYDGSYIALEAWDDWGNDYPDSYRANSTIYFSVNIETASGEVVEDYNDVEWTATGEKSVLPEGAFVDNYDGTATLFTSDLDPADIGDITVTVTYTGDDRGKNHTTSYTLTPYIAPLSYIELSYDTEDRDDYAFIAPVIDNTGSTAVYLVARDDEGEDCSDRVTWDCESDFVDKTALAAGKVTAANGAVLSSPFDKVTITATDKENPDSIVYYTVMMYDSAVHTLNDSIGDDNGENYHVFQAADEADSTKYCVIRHDLPAAYCTLHLNLTTGDSNLYPLSGAYDAMLADPNNEYDGVEYLGVCTHGQNGANDNYPQDEPPMFSVGRGSDILASGIYADTTFDRAYPGDTLQVTSTILNDAWSVSLDGKPIAPNKTSIDTNITRSRIEFTIPDEGSIDAELVITQTIDGVDYSISTIVEDPGPTFTVKLGDEVIVSELATSGNVYLPIIGMSEPVEVTVISSYETAWDEETGYYRDWYVYGAYENYVPADGSKSITMTLYPSELTGEIIYVDQPRDDYRYWEIYMYVTEAETEHQ